LTTLLERKPEQIYGALAALAAISQGSIANIHETIKPDAAAEWKKFCEEFRDAALKVNAAAHQYAKDKADGKEPNYAAFDTGFKAMTKSCDSCHKVFYPSAVGKNE
jgi:cytochrome c556